MSPEQVLDRIRALARRDPGLFRMHRTQGPLYARARRMFGTWSRAVQAAGLDYSNAIAAAIRRSVRSRRTTRKAARRREF